MFKLGVMYLLGYLIGGLIVYLCMKKYKKVDTSNPYLSYGIYIGLSAGWYAALGEDEDPDFIKDVYLNRLNEDK